MNTITCIKIEETGNYLVKINPGTYEIDGKLVTVDGYSTSEVQVKDAKNIRRFQVSNVVVGYKSDDGELSVKEYEEQLSLLASKGYDSDYELVFDDIDDEYAYKKFKQKWQPVYGRQESYSEPLVFTEALVRLETDNPFISSMFTTQAEFSDIYTYNRIAATMQIVRDTFTELGMVETADKGYASTAREKTFHIPGHSHVRYTQAFGTYCFNDSWEVKSNQRGSLEQMKAQYAADKKKYSNHLKVMYNNHFGEKSLDIISAKRIRSDLVGIAGSVSEIDPKQKSVGSKRAASSKITELIKYLDEVSLEG